MSSEMDSVPKFNSFRRKRSKTSQRVNEGNLTAPITDQPQHQGFPRDTKRVSKNHSNARSRRHSPGASMRSGRLDSRRADSDRSQYKTPSFRDYENSTWFEDRNGDQHNVTYGSVDRYKVPQYHRIGIGFVLGGPQQRIDREASSITHIALVKDNSLQVSASASHTIEHTGNLVDDHDNDAVAVNRDLSDKSAMSQDYLDVVPDRASSNVQIVTPKG